MLKTGPLFKDLILCAAESEVLTYSVPWLVSKRLAGLGFPWPVSEERRNVCVFTCVFLNKCFLGRVVVFGHLQRQIT